MAHGDGDYRATYYMASWCLSPPRHQVWVLYGDGSLGYSLMEFDTFVRHKVRWCQKWGEVGGK